LVLHWSRRGKRNELRKLLARGTVRLPPNQDHSDGHGFGGTLTLPGQANGLGKRRSLIFECWNPPLHAQTEGEIRGKLCKLFTRKSHPRASGRMRLP
jgi:hypothetical protein